MWQTADSYEVGSAPWEQGSASSHPDSFPVGSAPWEISTTPQSSAKQAFFDNLGNSATLGYAPQIAGKITQWLSPSKDEIASVVRPDIAAKPDKTNIPYNPYLIGRDTTSQALAQEYQEHPRASLAGGLTGALGSAVLVPIPGAGASSIGGGILKGAAVGAGYGAASNPGDTEGVIDPTQLGARLSNAGRGALIGGVAGGVTQGVSKGFNALANSPESLQGAANSQANSASGAMLKDFRALNGANREQAVGQFALDKGIVKSGDTFETVGQKAAALKQDAGQRLNTLYQAANKAAESDTEPPSVIGFNPIRDKEEILNAVRQKLGVAVDKKGAVNAVSDYLDELGQDHGNAVLDPKTANDVETAVSKKVDYMRNPVNPAPTNEKAFSIMRKIVSDKVDGHIEYLADQMGDPLAAEKLAEANKDYGFASTISKMAKDRANRILANNKLSLTDTIAGGAGAGAGALVGAASGDSKEGALGAIAGGIGMAALHHYGKTYAPAMLASGLNNAAKVANYGPAQFGQVASQVINPSTAGALTRAIGQVAATNGQQNNLPQGGNMPVPAPTPQPQQMQPAPFQPNLTPTPANPNSNNASSPKLGPEKWAADGFQNLRSHATDEDQKMLEENKDRLMLDPKAKNLLMTAQSYQPGSKPLDDIMKHLKKIVGNQK